MTRADLFGRDLIETQEWSRDELDLVLQTAKDLKKRHCSGKVLPDLLMKKIFFALFYNTSTRTRASFEAAMTLLGGDAQYIEASTTRLGQGEAVKDVARVYSRYGNGIGIRVGTLHEYPPGAATRMIREFAQFADIPVVNMANDEYHPCQGLADIMSVQEKFPKYEKKKFVIAWAYSGKIRTPCSINADALIMTRYGLDVVVACPPEFELDPKITDLCKVNSEESGGSLTVDHDLRNALRGGHLVFPRSWTTQNLILNGLQAVGGTEPELEVHRKYKHWRLTSELVDQMDRSAKIMHVMPVYRDLEADDELMDGTRSMIIDQAENRLHAQMGVLALTMGKSMARK
jgi:ornithine carbamoyltransferase